MNQLRLIAIGFAAMVVMGVVLQVVSTYYGLSRLVDVFDHPGWRWHLGEGILAALEFIAACAVASRAGKKRG